MDAIGEARKAGLDLVLIAEQADPPVCRIVDYGKYKYEKEKREKETKRKVQDVKGIKLRPGTAEHDLQVLVRNAIKFLGEGHKVRIVCTFRQRELAHPEVGQRKVDILIQSLGEFAKVESPGRQNGRDYVVVLSPKAGGSTKKDAKAEDQQNRGEEV